MTDYEADALRLEIRERLAKIDQANADAARRRQEFELGQKQFWLSAVLAAAALLAAGVAFGALLARSLGG